MGGCYYGNDNTTPASVTAVALPSVHDHSKQQRSDDACMVGARNFPHLNVHARTYYVYTLPLSRLNTFSATYINVISYIYDFIIMKRSKTHFSLESRCI